ncbi:MAG: helix-turn-helix domain-containing protein [Gammaproteobacteria bacterium]|nr:helix-turn-helix domain-containing protein [Gammaproteobacteria bacterium]
MARPIARSEKQLGAILRRIRKHHGLTQSQLGGKTGLRQATISKLEAGAPATRLATIMITLAALDLELAVCPRSQARTEDIEDLF